MEQKLSDIRDNASPGDLVEGVELTGTELDKKGVKVFFTRVPAANAKLIVYPNDSLVHLGQAYDLVVDRVVRKNDGAVILCEIYQELKVGDCLQVRLSGRSKRGEFMFRLYNYIGFLKRGDGTLYRRLSMFDYVSAEVREVQEAREKEGRVKKNYVHAIPLEILASTD